MIIILIVIKIISAKPIPECETIDLLSPDIPEEWAEAKVIGPFRVWHLIFIGFGLFVGLIVILCCIFRCRIPRTKQEIEADFVRKNITKAFERHLNRIGMDELNKEDSNGSKLLPALQKVTKLEETRIHKQLSFDEGKPMNWRQRLKTIFALEKQESQRSLSFEDGDDIKPMTKEEREAEARRKKDEEKRMKEVDAQVQNVKIDTSAFSIFDHITVLEPNFMMGSFGLSEKERKKREKEEEKERIKMMKEEKKLEKKRMKEEEKLKKELEKEKRRDSKQKKQQQQLKAILGESFEVDTQTSVNQKNNNRDNQIEDDQIEEEPLP